MDGGRRRQRSSGALANGWTAVDDPAVEDPAVEQWAHGIARGLPGFCERQLPESANWCSRPIGAGGGFLGERPV